MRKAYTADDGRYLTYYMNQAGGELPGFIGASTQYGHGLGGIFRNLFRMAVPLLKKGFNIAKPHLKTAATSIIGDVVSAGKQSHGVQAQSLKKNPTRMWAYPGCEQKE